MNKKAVVLLLLLGLACLIIAATDVFRRFGSRGHRQEEQRLRNSDHNRRDLQDGNDNNNTIVGGSESSTTISYFVHFSSGACGATLITADTVLTAAHCVDSGFPSSVRVATRTTSDGVTVSVDTANSAFHPSWTGDLNLGYDVAVLKLSSSVDTATYVPVTLNSDCFVPCPFEAMTTYGFGRTSSSGSVSSTLKVLDTTYQWTLLPPFIPQHILTLASSSTGVCFGDSGGPLLIGNTQVGVTSFVQGDCAVGNPDGFARVSTYYSWIRDHVCAVGSDTSNFDCSLAGTCCAYMRDFLRGIRSGVSKAMVGMASLVGLGPEPLIDPRAFPMYQNKNLY